MRRLVNPLERWNWHGAIDNNPLGIRVKIERKLSFDDFKFSVFKLIKKNPILNVKIILDENNHLWFDTENASDCSINFFPKKEKDDWIRVVEHIFNTQSTFSEGPITTFILIDDLEFSDIIIITTHTIIDGMGLIYLINELLILISNPNLEVENGMFPPPIEELIPEPLKLTKNLEDIKIPLLNKEKYKNVLHRPVSIQVINIEKEKLNKLIDFGKENETTMHSILSCFFLISFAKTFSERNLRRIGAISPANLRPYLANEYQDFIGMYSTPGLDISFNYSDIKGINSLDNIQNLIKKFNKKLKSRYEIKKIFDFTLFLTENLHRIDDIAINNLIDKNAEIGFAISNLGIYPFDLKYDNFKLLELNLISDPSYPSLKLMINSFKDKMFINILFKLDAFNSKDITRFKNNFFKIFEFIKNA